MNILRNVRCLEEVLSKFSYNRQLLVKEFCSKIEQRNIFFNEEVQTLLKKLTKPDLDKVFRPQKLGQRLVTPELKFMTDEELEQVQNEFVTKTQNKLQMPPVMSPRSEINEVLTKDNKLIGYTSSKYVFTDISYGQNDRNRHIVVRDADGTLRKAKWEERERMNEIYFPRPGRKLRIPQMFKQPYIDDLLNRGCFEFILNRACAQFEPDDPLYINLAQTTYDRIADARKFQEFESTRHFGPMVYYYAEQQKLAPLLIYYLNYDRLEDILSVIELHSKIHNRESSYSSGDELSVVKKFIGEYYPDNSELQLAFKSYEDYVSRPKSEAAV